MTQTHGTRQYEISHGRTPSGRGNWAIEVTAWSDDEERTETIFPGLDLTVTEARQAAIDRMKCEFEEIIDIHTEVLP